MITETQKVCANEIIYNLQQTSQYTCVVFTRFCTLKNKKKQNGNQNRYSIVLKTNVSHIPCRRTGVFDSIVLFPPLKDATMQGREPGITSRTFLMLGTRNEQTVSPLYIPCTEIHKAKRENSPTFKIPSRFLIYVPALGTSAIQLPQ